VTGTAARSAARSRARQTCVTGALKDRLMMAALLVVGRVGEAGSSSVFFGGGV